MCDMRAPPTGVKLESGDIINPNFNGYRQTFDGDVEEGLYLVGNTGVGYYYHDGNNWNNNCEYLFDYIDYEYVVEEMFGGLEKLVKIWKSGRRDVYVKVPEELTVDGDNVSSNVLKQGVEEQILNIKI